MSSTAGGAWMRVALVNTQLGSEMAFLCCCSTTVSTLMLADVTNAMYLHLVQLAAAK
jgi:hypothetical protein